LKDSAHIAEKDAEYSNRKGFSRHKPALPLYTMRDAERALKHLKPAAFAKEIVIADGVGLTLRRAGHILGAATAELRMGERTIVFSGDLGRYDDVFMPDPEPIAAADYVVVESTYGNRIHAKHDPMEALGAVIERTVQRGGTVVIPAFAVGRTQVLLYHLWMLQLRARRLGLITQPEAIVLMRTDCHVCKSEGLAAGQTRTFDADALVLRLLVLMFDGVGRRALHLRLASRMLVIRLILARGAMLAWLGVGAVLSAVLAHHAFVMFMHGAHAATRAEREGECGASEDQFYHIFSCDG
jgi:hypothetical protein